jgi:hypothetical protein
MLLVFYFLSGLRVLSLCWPLYHWNESWQEDPKNSGRARTSVTLFITNVVRPDLGLNHDCLVVSLWPSVHVTDINIGKYSEMRASNR